MTPLRPIAGSAVMVQGGERKSRSMTRRSEGIRWKPTSVLGFSGMRG